MADVIKRTANADGTHEYRKSVNTPDFPTADWLVNPDLSGVAAVPERHRKVVGETVVEMTQAEKDAVDTVPDPVGDDQIYLKSPDGTAWKVTIDNAGALQTAVA